MNVDAILIFPPGWDTPQPPLGLACLAAYLEGRGVRTRVIDLNRVEQTNPDQLAPAIEQAIVDVKSAGVRIVGMSLVYSNFPAALALARRLKREIPGLTIVAGGPQVSFIRERLLARYGDAFDLGVVSEGERPLLECVTRVAAGRELGGIAGTIARAAAGIVSHPPPPPLAPEEIPTPDFSGIDLSTYVLPMLPIATTRGCNRACVFCGVIGNAVTGSYRERPLAAVVAELRRGVTELGAKTFMFTDSLLNSRPARLRQLCRAILAEKLDIRWIAEVFPDLAPPDLALMHEAGCRFLWISPETGHAATARRMGKGVDLERARQTIVAAHEAGIFVSVWFILGFPGESRAAIRETVAYARSLAPFMDECTFATFSLMLGSPIHRRQREYGILWSTPLGYHTIAAFVSRENVLQRGWVARLASELYDELNPGRRYPFEVEARLGIASAPAWLRPLLRLRFRYRLNPDYPLFRYADLFASALGLRVNRSGPLPSPP